MSSNSGFLQYILEEIIPPSPEITARGMFGGFGLYKKGVIFGLISNDQLYFKTNDTTRKFYEEKGSKPFSYQGKNKKIVSLNYYEVPVEIMEDKEKILQWIEIAYAVGKMPKKMIK
jgi:DNA transformation protein